MYININITFTFMYISRFILVSKSTSFTFFIWIFTNPITFFHVIFIYVHTFFHRQIMCGCRLAIYLCDIWHASYERRFHSSLVAPSEQIWATFAFTLDKDMPTADSGRHACPICLRSVAAIIYRHILLGENSFDIIRTRTHEKIRLDFFPRRAIICTVYCWEKCKKL